MLILSCLSQEDRLRPQSTAFSKSRRREVELTEAGTAWQVLQKIPGEEGHGHLAVEKS